MHNHSSSQGSHDAIHRICFTPANSQLNFPQSPFLAFTLLLQNKNSNFPSSLAPPFTPNQSGFPAIPYGLGPSSSSSLSSSSSSVSDALDAGLGNCSGFTALTHTCGLSNGISQRRRRRAPLPFPAEVSPQIPRALGTRWCGHRFWACGGGQSGRGGWSQCSRKGEVCDSEC
jgi:hypothetical protein